MPRFLVPLSNVLARLLCRAALFTVPGFGHGARVAGSGDTWEEALQAAGILPKS